MQRYFLIIIFFSISLFGNVLVANAQEVDKSKVVDKSFTAANPNYDLRAFEGHIVPKLTTLPRGADRLWTKTIWRIIDVREKRNLQLYYPKTAQGPFKNLILALVEGIEEGVFEAYNTDVEPGDEFTRPIDIDKVKQDLGGGVHETTVQDFDENDNSIDVIKTTEEAIKTEQVYQYMLKELWFFDTKQSKMKVKIIAMAPIRYYRKDVTDPDSKPIKMDLFWVRYDDVREHLANHFIMDPYNSNTTVSFDNIFMSRRFNSYIIREGNVYDNRALENYIVNDEVLKESIRITEEMFNWEQDLWEY